MPPAIEARSLTKRYGRQRGIEELTLSVEPGEVYGYLGPNGSGKTTTIRLMLDFVRPTRGELRVLGVRPKRSRHIRQRIGYLPGELGLLEYATGRQSLDLYASLSGAGAPLRDWLCEALQFPASDLRRRARTYSKGMKQKLGIIQAMQHDPELLILDEPTGGLDPVVQARFFEVLREFKRRGRTVFFSSHVLSEVEAICDRVGVLRDGRLVLDARVGDLKSRADRLLYVKLSVRRVLPSQAIAAAASPAITAPGSGAPPHHLSDIPTTPPSGTAFNALRSASLTDPFDPSAPSDPSHLFALPHPPRIGRARYLRTEDGWLIYAVSPPEVPGVLRDLAQLYPEDFRLESALEQSFLRLYGVGSGKSGAPGASAASGGMTTTRFRALGAPLPAEVANANSAPISTQPAEIASAPQTPVAVGATAQELATPEEATGAETSQPPTTPRINEAPTE